MREVRERASVASGGRPAVLLSDSHQECMQFPGIANGSRQGAERPGCSRWRCVEFGSIFTCMAMDGVLARQASFMNQLS